MLYLRLILLSLMLIAYEAGAAGVLDKRDFLISQDYSYSEQNSPSIAVGQNEKFAVVWADYRYGQGDLYCRLYDSGAVEVGDNFILNDDDVSAWQLDPDLSSDRNGNYFVVWIDYRNSAYPFDPDIYFQSLDSAGFDGVNRNITIETPDSSHQSPAIGVTDWGKKIIAWTDLRHFNWDLFIQIVDTGDALIGINTQINDDNSGAPQHEPDLAVSREGWFVAVWYDSRSGHDDVFIQKFDSSGTPMGGNIRVNDDGTTSKQKFPSVAIGGNDVIFIVWLDWCNGNYPDNPDVYGQRLDSNFNRLGGNIIINTDGAQRAQRDPKVAADRLGYACVVWSDSTALDWNIKGQLFSSSGATQGGNFAVNLDTEGKQLNSDLAMDGHNLYFVWADDRNGDYDIYGRLYQYNDPSLVASPAQVEFTRDRDDPDPAAVGVNLTNAGFDEISYRLEADRGWITLSKSSGMTPDSFTVSVSSALMDHGIYQGTVWLVNDLLGDTVGYLPVTLTINGPIIDLVPDSLNFRALIEIGPPDDQTAIINNVGTGTLDFMLTPSASWLTLDKATGSDGENIQVGCDISSLTAGNYEGYIITNDTGAVNGPGTLFVSLDLQENMPWLGALPDMISIELDYGDSSSGDIQVVNLGSATIDWTAASSAAWLTLLSNSGQDNDRIDYAVEASSLAPGRYVDSIVITDSQAFNNPLPVPFELLINSTDTVEIVPAQSELGGSIQAPIYLNNTNSFSDGVLRFHYDKSLLTVDSLGAPVGPEVIENRLMAIDTGGGSFTVTIPYSPEKISFGAGHYHLGDIYATANDTLTGTAQILADESADSFYLDLDNGPIIRPAQKGGEVEISIASAVDDFDPDIMPSVFYLEQNSPNPFNGVTSISFSLKRSGSVRLVIFNILGQQVDVLADGYLTAGRHQTSWDGRDSDGRDMATGIYFYRLSTADVSAVKKLVYLK